MAIEESYGKISSVERALFERLSLICTIMLNLEGSRQPLLGIAQEGKGFGTLFLLGPLMIGC